MGTKTRFRAYQLGNPGSSFSYFANGNMTLIEARLPDTMIPSLNNELETLKVKGLSCLHITSWDQDHCNLSELEKILYGLSPRRIEYPGYMPHSQSGIDCKKLLSPNANSVALDKAYISTLSQASPKDTSNILYNNKKDYENANNNSNIKLFRSGNFTVLSLGDLEHPDIADWLITIPSIKQEVDVLILAHHGADNGFTTAKFLQAVSPSVAICSSNYDNQYDHPRQEIRNILHQNDIALFTTKTGDVIIESNEDTPHIFTVYNLQAGSTELSSKKNFFCKRYKPIL